MKTLRYFISSAGIIIGIAAAIVVLGICEGGRSVLNDSFWANDVRVYDIELSDKSSGSGEYLSRNDGRLLEDKMPAVKGSIPVLKLNAQLKSYKASGTALTLAVNEGYQQYANLEMLAGSFISLQDVRHANRVAVIDDHTALELFGTTDIIGQKLDLEVSGKEIEFAICGVVRNFNKNIETLFEDEIPGMCYIPDSVPEDVSFDYDVERIIALVEKGLHEEEAAVRLGHLLEREHGAGEVYDIEEYEQLSYVSDFAEDYTAFAVIAAVLCLVLGGIGLMNSMLVTLQERKKEIGLYKFYGSDIRRLQYEVVYRSLIIGIGCGIGGLMLGLLVGNFIGSFININSKVTLMSILVSTAVPAFVSILSSLYPASLIEHVDVSEVIWGE